MERLVGDVRPRVFCNSECYAESVRREGRKGRPRTHSEIGASRITGQGYAVVYVGAEHPMSMSSRSYRGWALQHRVVMAEKIGRPLTSIENVHHKNGVRSDNRPENLELWVKSQPHGQRVADVLAWAREIVATYEPIEARLS